MPRTLIADDQPAVQAAVRSFASAAIEPDELCARVNRVLCSNLTTGKFVAFFYCLLDAATNRLSYANAGHEPPILLRSSGEAVRPGEGGSVLGVFPEGNYGQATVEPATGSCCSPTAVVAYNVVGPNYLQTTVCVPRAWPATSSPPPAPAASISIRRLRATSR